jgi:hypothetical protein
LPLIGIKNEISLGQLEIVKAPGLPIENAWYLVHLEEKKLLPAAQAFKSFLELNLTKITQQHFDF